MYRIFLVLGVLSLIYLGFVLGVSSKAYSTDAYQFYDIIFNISNNRTFDMFKYNCWDYSTDLVKALTEQGYKAKIVNGNVNCSCPEWDKKSCTGNHAWVELDLMIEATSGIIISPELYARCYRFGYYSVPKFNPFK